MMLLSALALSLLLQATRLFRAMDRRRATKADMGSGWGSTLAITQDARQLIVEPAIFSRYDGQPAVRIALCA